jgi:GntR family transcriptional regulator
VEIGMTFSDPPEAPSFANLADPTVDLSTSHVPIYLQLSTLFRKFIVRNQWPVGERIPNQEALAAQFDINPATVRKAINVLERDGLVKCSRRRGTFVTAKPPSVHWYDVATSWSAALRAYDGLTPKLLEAHDVKELPARLRAATSPARRYRRLRRLYHRGQVPLLVEDCYLDDRICQKVDGAELRHTPAIKLTDRFVRVKHADQTLRFGIADGEISQLLDLPLNAPLAIVHLRIDDEHSVRCFESTAYIRGDTIRAVEAINFAKRAK